MNWLNDEDPMDRTDIRAAHRRSRGLPGRLATDRGLLTELVNTLPGDPVRFGLNEVHPLMNRFILHHDDAQRMQIRPAAGHRRGGDTGFRLPVQLVAGAPDRDGTEHLPRRFLQHGDRAQMLEEHGFGPAAIAGAVRTALAGGRPYQHQPDRA